MADPETDAVRAAMCPDCGREKAYSVEDAIAGKCPKWWAIRDDYAEKDCQRVARAALSLPSPQVVDDRGEIGLPRGAASGAEEGERLVSALRDYLRDIRDGAEAALDARLIGRGEALQEITELATAALSLPSPQAVANPGKSRHADWCAYHLDQYDQECDCRAALTGSHTGDDPKALDAAARSQSTADLPQGVEPVAWPNDCDKSVPAALRFLAENDRPSGGEQRFNRAHLYQLAAEVERMASRPLYTAEALAEALAAERARADRAEEALRWYGEQAEACRKVTSDGAVARQALDADGGRRARNILKETPHDER